jgi:hypothetical protein
MSEQALSQHSVQLFSQLVMELDMASCEAQLVGMGLQQSQRRSSIGSASSTGSYMSNEEFEDFLLAALQEELAEQVADGFQVQQQ